MNFEFTEEQKLFVEAVRKFALAELEADALKRAHNPRFPFDVAQRMSRQGLMGITLSEADGGQGGSLMDAVIAIEQVALVCPRSADVVQSGSFGPIRTFAEYASPALKNKYLADLLAGRTVMSLGMSEPEAGSAARNGASCISIIAAFRPTTCCLARVASRSRWRVSTWNVSAMRRARSPLDGMPSTRRAIMWQPECSSAAPYANSRACSGNSPTWRSSSKAHSCCSTGPPPMRIVAFRPLTKLRWPRRPATLRGSRWRTRPCRPWEPPATAATPWWNTACADAEVG